MRLGRGEERPTEVEVEVERERWEGRGEDKVVIGSLEIISYFEFLVSSSTFPSLDLPTPPPIILLNIFGIIFFRIYIYIINSPLLFITLKTPQNLEILYFVWLKKLYFLTFHVCKNLMKPAIYP
jgi:hypothetical protein